jgi:hypothetical protein
VAGPGRVHRRASGLTVSPLRSEDCLAGGPLQVLENSRLIHLKTTGGVSSRASAFGVMRGGPCVRGAKTVPVSTTSAFSTTFDFTISNPGGAGTADGIALVFQNTGTSAHGSSGGSLGIDIPDSVTPGGSVAAELQTFWQTYGIVQNTDAPCAVLGRPAAAIP